MALPALHVEARPFSNKAVSSTGSWCKLSPRPRRHGKASLVETLLVAHADPHVYCHKGRHVGRADAAPPHALTVFRAAPPQASAPSTMRASLGTQR